MNFSINMKEPKLISVQEFGFKREEDHIVLDVNYFIKGVEVSTVDGSNMRRIDPVVYTKQKISVPIMNIENGEDIYFKYTEMLEVVKDILYIHHNIENKESYYKESVQKRIEEHKAKDGIKPPDPED